MKLGYLIALSLTLVGLIGVGYGIYLSNDSSFGIVVVSGACTFPIALACSTKTRDKSGDEFLQKEIKFTNITKGENK